MGQVVWSPSALEDIEQVAPFIARDSSDQAALFVGRLIEATDRLSSVPLSGRVIPETGHPDCREIIYGAYPSCWSLPSVSWRSRRPSRSISIANPMKASVKPTVMDQSQMSFGPFRTRSTNSARASAIMRNGSTDLRGFSFTDTEYSSNLPCTAFTPIQLRHGLRSRSSPTGTG